MSNINANSLLVTGPTTLNTAAVNTLDANQLTATNADIAYLSIGTLYADINGEINLQAPLVINLSAPSIVMTGDVLAVSTTQLQVEDPMITLNRGGLSIADTCGIEVEVNNTIVATFGTVSEPLTGNVLGWQASHTISAPSIKCPDLLVTAINSGLPNTLNVYGTLNVAQDPFSVGLGALDVLPARSSPLSVDGLGVYVGNPAGGKVYVGPTLQTDGAITAVLSVKGLTGQTASLQTWGTAVSTNMWVNANGDALHVGRGVAFNAGNTVTQSPLKIAQGTITLPALAAATRTNLGSIAFGCTFAAAPMVILQMRTEAGTNSEGVTFSPVAATVSNVPSVFGRSAIAVTAGAVANWIAFGPA